jgi:hypothetical protein
MTGGVHRDALAGDVDRLGEMVWNRDLRALGDLRERLEIGTDVGGSGRERPWAW